MISAYLTLFVALVIATIAGWFSVVGLMALYGASAIPVLIMGGSLEAGKLVTASWLYRNWTTETKTFLAPGVAFVVILMVITSMGIFGFLSKAHTEQGGPVANAQAQIDRLNNDIAREQRVIDDANTELDQLDLAIAKLLEFNKVSGPDGSRAVRESQKPERVKLTENKKEPQANIDKLMDQKFELEQKVRDFEKEVGPVKYLAALIYADPENNIDSAIRIITMMLIFVFDPLAVWLLIAANRSLAKIGLRKDKLGTDNGQKENIPTEKVQQRTPTTQPVRQMVDDLAEHITNSADKTTYHSDAGSQAPSKQTLPSMAASDARSAKETQIIPEEKVASQPTRVHGTPPKHTTGSANDGTSGAPDIDPVSKTKDNIRPEHIHKSS